MRARLKLVLVMAIMAFCLIPLGSAHAANPPMSLVLGAPNGVASFPSGTPFNIFLNASTRVGVVPTGSVDVALDGAIVQSVPADSLYGAGVTVSIPATSAGTHTVGAAYAGDAQYAGSATSLAVTVYPSNTPPVTQPPVTQPPVTQPPAGPSEQPDEDVAVDSYRLISRGGQAFDFGTASAGAVSGGPLSKPVVGGAATPTGRGWWAVTANGAVIAAGDAAHHGDAAGIVLSRPIVGMAATPTGLGYWLVASDGGIFSYGDAQFFGSTGAITLNKPIVGMASTPTGLGYWLVASDGGIFAYGDAQFFGSTGSMVLNQPVVGMASTPTGQGYWLVASDGGIFAYGDADFYGSAGSLSLNKPIIGMQATASGDGYWFVASDAGVFAYGDAPFRGTVGGRNDIAAFIS